MASTIITKNGTGSAEPTSLQQGELAINVDQGNLYYGTSGSTAVSSSFIFTSVSASSFQGDGSGLSNVTATLPAGVVSASATHITASGNISSSGTVTADNINVDQAVTFGGNKRILYSTANENIVVQDSSLAVNNHITASGNISASGDIAGNTITVAGTDFINLHATGYRVNSGAGPLNLFGNRTITGNSIVGTLGTAAQTNITSVGTLSSLTVSGDITANGNIVGDDATDITNIESIFADNLVHDGDTDTKIAFGTNTVQVDAGGTTVFESSVTGSVLSNVHQNIFDTGSVALAANSAFGDIVKFGGTATTAGGLYYLKPDGTWGFADADAAGTATSSLAVAIGTNSTTDGMCLRGFVNPFTDPGVEVGNPVYVSTTVGRISGTAPNGTGDVVRIVGYQYGTDLVYFNPSNDFIIHA
jgi:hypothetical protein